MSQVQDKFYEIFALKMEKRGFSFKKSKNSFIKQDGDFQFIVRFGWDGRGGTSIIDNIMYYVGDLKIKKAYKQLIGYESSFGQIYCHIPLYAENGKLLIPVMYTQAVLDLANKMNFKALAAIPFEEKYPIERIQRCVDTVEKLLELNVFPFFEANSDAVKAYETLYKQVEGLENIAKAAPDLSIFLKLYSKRLNLPLPKAMQNNQVYVDSLKNWHGIHAKPEWDTLHERTEKYQF